jgi:hypothetical protein
MDFFEIVDFAYILLTTTPIGAMLVAFFILRIVFWLLTFFLNRRKDNASR